MSTPAEPPMLCAECHEPLGGSSFFVEGRGPFCVKCLRGLGKRKVKGLIARVRRLFGVRSS